MECVGTGSMLRVLQAEATASTACHTGTEHQPQCQKSAVNTDHTTGTKTLSTPQRTGRCEH